MRWKRIAVTLRLVSIVSDRALPDMVDNDLYRAQHLREHASGASA
ncbi:MAG: hypothetical protein AAF626_02595 [Pseudomonadota bacterium]